MTLGKFLPRIFMDSSRCLSSDFYRNLSMDYFKQYAEIFPRISLQEFLLGFLPHHLHSDSSSYSSKDYFRNFPRNSSWGASRDSFSNLPRSCKDPFILSLIHCVIYPVNPSQIPSRISPETALGYLPGKSLQGCFQKFTQQFLQEFLQQSFQKISTWVSLKIFTEISSGISPEISRGIHP